jgi:hypothetical protein
LNGAWSRNAEMTCSPSLLGIRRGRRTRMSAGRRSRGARPAPRPTSWRRRTAHRSRALSWRRAGGRRAASELRGGQPAERSRCGTERGGSRAGRRRSLRFELGTSIRHRARRRAELARVAAQIERERPRPAAVFRPELLRRRLERLTPRMPARGRRQLTLGYLLAGAGFAGPERGRRNGRRPLSSRSRGDDVGASHFADLRSRSAPTRLR